MTKPVASRARSKRSKARYRTARVGLLCWVALGLIYFLLAGQASMTELMAGLGGVSAASGYGVALHIGARRRPLEFRLAWLRSAWRPLLSLPRDSLAVGLVLLRSLTRRRRRLVGRMTRQPFDYGNEGAEARARRALVILGASLAPNGFVLHALKGEGVLLLHRLAPDAPSENRDWPL
jgi:hypothetical protein